MSELFIVEACSDLDGTSDIVGVYSTFDECVKGADAYKFWFQSDREIWITPTILDCNLTKDCARYIPFKLEAGRVPRYHYEGSAYHERFIPPCKE